MANCANNDDEDDSDSEDEEQVDQEGIAQFMKECEGLTVDELDEQIAEAYAQADADEQEADLPDDAEPPDKAGPSVHIASTARRSTINAKKIDWEKQKDFKPKEQEDWRDKVQLGEKHSRGKNPENHDLSWEEP